MEGIRDLLRRTLLGARIQWAARIEIPEGTDALNMVGSFRSRAAALRAVAETARQYGEDSEDVRSLVLFRQDGPPDDAHVAEGVESVRFALAAEASAGRSGSIQGDMLSAEQQRRRGASVVS